MVNDISNSEIFREMLGALYTYVAIVGIVIFTTLLIISKNIVFIADVAIAFIFLYISYSSSKNKLQRRRRDRERDRERMLQWTDFRNQNARPATRGNRIRIGSNRYGSVVTHLPGNGGLTNHTIVNNDENVNDMINDMEKKYGK